MAEDSLLTPRWTPLRYHAEQMRLWNSSARFRVVPSGRRSGKTELAKRFIVLQALEHHRFSDAWYICAAPTFGQAREVYWNDLKLMVPSWAVNGRISETLLDIPLINGARLSVRGMDRPERIEGPPIDGMILDEYANMKKETWEAHVRPALATVGRPGWAWLIGVPEGRSHYYQIAQKAKADTTGVWDFFSWYSADIMDPEEIAELQATLDARTFAQECQGAFQDFEGRAYYNFMRETHAALPLKYMPQRDLIFAFDFNVSPGVAVVLQEQPFKGKLPDGKKPPTDGMITAILDEVHIPNNSNTPAVCNKLVREWGDHRGRVLAYGDATGGARGTAQTQGTDWELIYEIMRREFGKKFSKRVPKANPPERSRVNALNGRIESADGRIGLLVDQDKAPHAVEDLEGVVLLKGGSGEIDKKTYPDLTHLTDALGYYMEKVHPVRAGPSVRVQSLVSTV